MEKAEGILGESADKILVGRLVDILAEKETELQTVNHLARLEKVKAKHIGVINTIKAVAEANSLNKMYVISSAYKKQLSAITIR